MSSITSKLRILVTGGAGFIGSALVRKLVQSPHFHILNIDNLTYAANPNALSGVSGLSNYRLERMDICNKDKLLQVVNDFDPDVVFHLAAESHVDNSIADASIFVQSNIVGTAALLDACRQTWRERKLQPRFIFVGTDEVYGANKSGSPYLEIQAFAPSSPYSASKAAATHLVQSWQITYGFPAIISHSTNNYGPFQHPEKLLPKALLMAAQGQSIPIYGDGNHQRDWLYVDDHVNAMILLMKIGVLGETYHIGTEQLHTNNELLLALSNAIKARTSDRLEVKTHFVEDRSGHDSCYWIDTSKIRQLGWSPKVSLEEGISQLVAAYHLD